MHNPDRAEYILRHYAKELGQRVGSRVTWSELDQSSLEEAIAILFPPEPVPTIPAPEANNRTEGRTEANAGSIFGIPAGDAFYAWQQDRRYERERQSRRE